LKEVYCGVNDRQKSLAKQNFDEEFDINGFSDILTPASKFRVPFFVLKILEMWKIYVLLLEKYELSRIQVEISSLQSLSTLSVSIRRFPQLTMGKKTF
jgi:hypothetical protein